jgi:hypothetical protein
MRFSRKLVILGLGAYGGYALWNRYGAGLGGRAAGTRRDGALPPDRRVNERSELTVTELAAGSDDPVAQATAIIADSDERTELPRDAPGVERRRSQDTVDP